MVVLCPQRTIRIVRQSELLKVSEGTQESRIWQSVVLKCNDEYNTWNEGNIPGLAGFGFGEARAVENENRIRW